MAVTSAVFFILFDPVKNQFIIVINNMRHHLKVLLILSWIAASRFSCGSSFYLPQLMPALPGIHYSRVIYHPRSRQQLLSCSFYLMPSGDYSHVMYTTTKFNNRVYSLSSKMHANVKIGDEWSLFLHDM